MTPSSPAPSKRRNQSSARARSRVAGERCTGGAASPSTCSRRARRRASGVSRRSSSPRASRSHPTNEDGVSAASSLTRDAAGWMRRSNASKSRPPAPTITISPSRTQRSGNVAARGATSSGKYRFIGFSSRLCSTISPPSRNTSVRKPSHLGSNCQPSPPGKASAALDSMGASGGAKGRDMAAGYRHGRAEETSDPSPAGANYHGPGAATNEGYALTIEEVEMSTLDEYAHKY